MTEMRKFPAPRDPHDENWAQTWTVDDFTAQFHHATGRFFVAGARLELSCVSRMPLPATGRCHTLLALLIVVYTSVRICRAR